MKWLKINESGREKMGDATRALESLLERSPVPFVFWYKEVGANEGGA